MNIGHDDINPDYQSWLDKGVWTFQESCWLFFDREPSLNIFLARDNLPDIAKPYCNLGELSFFKNLSDDAERYIISGKLKTAGKTSTGATLFKPKVILAWLNEITDINYSPELHVLLFPEKGIARQAVPAPIARHKEVFEQIQKEKPDLSREEEEREMRHRLKPQGYSRDWHRNLRKKLNKRPGRPCKDS